MLVVPGPSRAHTKDALDRLRDPSVLVKVSVRTLGLGVGVLSRFAAGSEVIGVDVWVLGSSEVVVDGSQLVVDELRTDPTINRPQRHPQAHRTQPRHHRADDLPTHRLPQQMGHHPDTPIG